jgi:hypothetical protein
MYLGFTTLALAILDLSLFWLAFPLGPSVAIGIGELSLLAVQILILFFREIRESR